MEPFRRAAELFHTRLQLAPEVSVQIREYPMYLDYETDSLPRTLEHSDPYHQDFPNSCPKV